MRKEFSAETPELFLIITDGKNSPKIEKAFQRGLDGLKNKSVALAVKIRPAEMKNLLTAVKLMDVSGIFLTGKFRKHVGLITDKTDSSDADTIVVKKGKYHAFKTSTGKSVTPEQIASVIKLWTAAGVK